MLTDLHSMAYFNSNIRFGSFTDSSIIACQWSSNNMGVCNNLHVLFDYSTTELRESKSEMSMLVIPA